MVGAQAGTRAVVVAHPRSGGGKPVRFDLVGRAERMGVEVRLIDAEHGAASLARRAVQEGAAVLGVVGGDGTVSAVAAVAADADRPLVVVPAGTRNHFARDLGLDIRDRVSALDAFSDGVSARVDLARVGPRVFVNNVSFGVYADALLDPGYREDKARTFAAVAPGYLKGEQWVEAGVDTPRGPVRFPQVVLVSNNPYHVATPPLLGAPLHARLRLARRHRAQAPARHTTGSAPAPSQRAAATERSGAGRGCSHHLDGSPHHPARPGAATARGNRRGTRHLAASPHL
ncbi:acylglycerol kinase family protein [Streptomyces olivaceiscleroticus]|uniref:DAGKc domain-containing protein n=1 Tax=Streptomyces olivaceiscleroticus TaxID=68245 RepID=A0ABN1A3N1_9ACTN